MDEIHVNYSNNERFIDRILVQTFKKVLIKQNKEVFINNKLMNQRGLNEKIYNKAMKTTNTLDLDNLILAPLFGYKS